MVIEDGTNTFLFNIFQSFTVVNTNDYTIQSTIGNRAVILIADAPNWYDETGTIPYDAASLLLFLETYTGQYPQPTSSNGLPTGGTAGQILAKIDATNYNAEWIDNYANWTSQLKHEVKAGESLVKGQAVYVSSADGTNMIVSKASNTLESTSSKTMGLIMETLATNGKGFIITEGLISGLNTSTATAGDPVWLGTNGNLIFGLTNKPSAPAHLVFIGIVTRSNINNGEIFVKVQNGFELQELHNVAITSPANKNTILFNSTTSLWENRLIAIDDVTNLQTELNGKVAGSGTTNYVSKFTASGTIGNSLIYDDSSSVGIGTTALQSRFHIYHTSAPSFNAVIGYNAMKLEYDGGNNEDDFGAGITFFQKWFSGSSLKVATGGIFGVKTNGDGNFGGGLSFFYTPLGSSTLTEGARLISAGHFGIGTIYPITKFQVRDGDGNFYVGNSFAKVENAGGTTASFYLADLTDSVALKNVGANLLFFNSSSEGMRLTNSGNLAIGRTTASEKLHIAGNMILDGVSNITSISTSAFGTLVSFDVASLDYTFGPITANPMTYGLTFSGNDIMFGNINSGAIPYKATIGFSDSPMFVNGLDIGIGTTSPLAKLHIYNGNLFVESGNIETSGSLRIAQQLIDSVYSAGNPNQFLISNSVGTLWSDLKTVNGNSLVGSGNISVQSTLVSGTNIKTINGSTILGSGDLTISGGSGLKGVHALIPLKSGDITNTVMISVNPLSSTAFTTNRLVAYPFIPNQDFTSSDLFINVNTLAAGSFCRIAVYSDLNGYPNTRLFVSSDLDCSTTGKKTALATINFVAGTTYWLVFHGGAVASTLSCILQAQSIPIKSNTVTSMANSYFYALAFTTPTPVTFLANQSAISQNLQYIGITKA